MFVNTHLLQTTELSSDRLGVLSSIVRPIHGGGYGDIGYSGPTHGIVYQKGQQIGSFTVMSSPEHSTMQAMVDLTSLNGRSRKMHLNEKGYLMLFVPTGDGGFHVTLRQEVDRKAKIVFDSSKMIREHDLFTASLVRPGQYKIVNTIAIQEVEVTLEYPENPASAPPKQIPPVYVGCYADRYTFELDGKPFDPKTDQLKTGQGMVFRINTDSELVIKLEKENPKNSKSSSGKGNVYRSVRWNNPRPPKGKDGSRPTPSAEG